MATQVYTFHVSYNGQEDCVWRKICVSSNYRLDHLGYLVLSVFGVKEYDMFEFLYDDVRFSFPSKENTYLSLNMTTFKLNHLPLQQGSLIRMDYASSTTHSFFLKLIDCKNMKKGQGKRYPIAVDGAGFAIIDDLLGEEQTYQKGTEFPQDSRFFDSNSINISLKYDIDRIEAHYTSF